MASAILSDSITNARTLTLAYSNAVSAKDIIVYNNQVLVAINSALANALNSYVWQGKVIFPKLTGVSFNPADHLYWDANAGNITNVQTGNTLAGQCLEPAASADTTINMFLDDNDAVQLAQLAAGITPSHVAKYAGQASYAGGGTSVAINVPGVLAADIALVTLGASTNAVTIQKAVCTTDTITVTFSADPGASTKVNYQVIRAAA